jgi:4-hydroxy-tetrahydrodipicolinate synthase
MASQLGPLDLCGRLISAVPAPLDAERRVHSEGQARYVEHLLAQPIGGVAVWAHTGRGLYLSASTRQVVVRSWRTALPRDRWLIAGAGPDPAEHDPARLAASARAMASEAADLGADALLVYPPTALRGHPDRDALVRDYHDAVARAGLPMILFYLYEAAGGIAYSESVLQALWQRDDVLGIKVATLDSVMTFQDLAAALRTCAPAPAPVAAKCLISGEDRFLGYSLICGADAALIGMGAVCAEPQARLISELRAGNLAEFLSLSHKVDAFARLTFRNPMEAYIGRLLACLAVQGVIPWDAATDPWGPPISAAEVEELRQGMNRLAWL